MGNEYVVVDCHCHVFKTELQGWQGRAIDNRYDKGGSLEQLLRYMDEAGISQAWGINAWPTMGMLQALEARLPKDLTGDGLLKAKAKVKDEVRGRLERANDWLCSTTTLAPGRVVPLIGLDPYFGSEWMVKELEDKFKKGAKGVKLIPTWGEFYPNDRRMWPAYAKMVELGMVILAHAGGADVLFSVTKTDYAFPKYWAEPLAEFPKLKVVLAHLANAPGHGPEPQKQRLDLAKRYSNVYFDIAKRKYEKGFDRVAEDMIRQVGVDRVLWGTDWHTHVCILTLEALKRSGLTDEEKRKILGENAQRLIKG